MHVVALIFCAMVTWLTTVASAEPLAVKGTPPALSRTIRVFDFEERDRGNVEDTPQGWLKVEGPGLPRYLNGVFDDTVSAAGRTSFRFDLNGGSVTYRYPAGRLPAMAHAAYRVSAMVRTTPLKHARARLTAYFCDVDGRILTRSIRATEPFVSEPDDPGFRQIALSLTATEPAAASIVIELSLLQPALIPDDKLGGQKLPVEDIHGSAWFDEVRIAQVPDVSIRTDRPTNVFPPGEPVNIRVQMRDRIATDLTGELRVFDVNDEPVFQRTGAIDFSGDDPSRPLLGTVPLPRLAPGWYDARLTIRSNDQFVADHSLKFVQLGPGFAAGGQGDPRFGIIATGFAPEVWSLLPEALERLAAGRLKLSAWSEKYAIDGDAAAATFDRLMDDLRARGVTITAVLSALPPEVRRNVGGDRWADLLKVPEDRWQTQFAYLLARHATHVSRWQLMNDDASHALASDPRQRDAFARVQEEFTKLIGAPDLAMPWPAWFEFEGYVPSRVALVVPPDVLPEQLPLYIQDLKARQSTRAVSLTLRPIERGRYGRLSQMRDLALRVGYALAGGAESIDLPLPMTTSRHRDGDVYAEPDKLLVAQRVITASLSHARFAGQVAIAPGIEAFLFDRGGPDGGVMLVFPRDQSPTAPVRHVPITLGRRALMVDLDGNVTPLGKLATPDRRRPDDFDLPVGPMPVFVTHVDAPLMLLRAGLTLDNPMLESSFRSHGRKLTFRNTFDEPIAGSIRLSGPAGWTVSMPATSFSLNPGDTFEAPVTIEFPLNSPAGDKTLEADLRIQGRDDYRITVPVAAKLGLTDVGLQTLAVRNGNDILVQQMITNYGSRPISYNAFISMPGQPRQERIVADIAPGKTTIRKYRLAAPRVDGPIKLRSGLKEIEGRRMLNEEVDVN